LGCFLKNPENYVYYLRQTTALNNAITAQLSYLCRKNHRSEHRRMICKVFMPASIFDTCPHDPWKRQTGLKGHYLIGHFLPRLH